MAWKMISHRGSLNYSRKQRSARVAAVGGAKGRPWEESAYRVLEALTFSPGCNRKPSKSLEQGCDFRFRYEKTYSGCYMEN